MSKTDQSPPSAPPRLRLRKLSGRVGQGLAATGAFVFQTIFAITLTLVAVIITALVGGGTTLGFAYNFSTGLFYNFLSYLSIYVMFCMFVSWLGLRRFFLFRWLFIPIPTWTQLGVFAELKIVRISYPLLFVMPLLVRIFKHINTEPFFSPDYVLLHFTILYIATWAFSIALICYDAACPASVRSRKKNNPKSIQLTVPSEQLSQDPQQLTLHLDAKQLNHVLDTQDDDHKKQLEKDNQSQLLIRFICLLSYLSGVLCVVFILLSNIVTVFDLRGTVSDIADFAEGEINFALDDPAGGRVIAHLRNYDQDTLANVTYIDGEGHLSRVVEYYPVFRLNKLQSSFGFAPKRVTSYRSDGTLAHLAMYTRSGDLDRLDVFRKGRIKQVEFYGNDGVLSILEQMRSDNTVRRIYEFDAIETLLPNNTKDKRHLLNTVYDLYPSGTMSRLRSVDSEGLLTFVESFDVDGELLERIQYQDGTPIRQCFYSGWVYEDTAVIATGTVTDASVNTSTPASETSSETLDSAAEVDSVFIDDISIFGGDALDYLTYCLTFRANPDRDAGSYLVFKHGFYGELLASGEFSARGKPKKLMRYYESGGLAEILVFDRRGTPVTHQLYSPTLEITTVNIAEEPEKQAALLERFAITPRPTHPAPILPYVLGYRVTTNDTELGHAPKALPSVLDVRALILPSAPIITALQRPDVLDMGERTLEDTLKQGVQEMFRQRKDSLDQLPTPASDETAIEQPDLPSVVGDPPYLLDFQDVCKRTNALVQREVCHNPE